VEEGMEVSSLTRTALLLIPFLWLHKYISFS
jgi:hypothetical protein